MNKIITIIATAFIGLQAHAETCSNELETQLAQLPDVLTQPRPIDNAIDLDKQCILASMDTFYNWTESVREERAAKQLPAIGHYGYCESSKQKDVKRLHTPPCQSELYTTVIQNSYNDVLKCLNMHPKKIFAITAVESGFHINTFSLSGQDIGIGQLIPAAIAEVNVFWNESIAEINASSNPACQNLQPLLANLENAPSSGAEQSCAMMALPENPVRNLLYKGLLHRFHDKQISKYFNQTGMKDRLQQFTGDVWTEEELANLKELLVFLAYNAGSQGAKDIFESFIAEKQMQLANWNNQYNELFGFYIDYYLRAMDLGSQGYLKEADDLLKERQNVKSKMNDLLTVQQTSFVSKSLFFAGDTVGGFGDYLLKNKKSEYINILLKRIDYIENSMLNAPGLCSQAGFLSGK